MSALDLKNMILSEKHYNLIKYLFLKAVNRYFTQI